jgi:outer membrane protein assembly factor BamB
MNSLRVSLVVLLLATGAAVRAQDGANVRGDSTQTRRRLAEAEQKLLAGKHADAADDIQRVLDEAGDDLITVDGKEYRTARRVAQGLLARLSADALRGYRDRVDEPARKLLAAAKRSNDTAPLRQLLDQYLVSRPAEEALLLLGDLLFEQGDFRAAEQTWRRLLPDSPPEFAYPAPTMEPAPVRARIVLAIIFQNDLARAKRELAAFREKHPGASGPLAGKDGPFTDTLQASLDHPPSLALPANASTDWPTFGGGANRSGRVAARLSGQWPNRPTWTAGLNPDPRLRHVDAPAGPPRRPPFGHPVVIGEHAFVTDGWQVQAFNLLNGRRSEALGFGKPVRDANTKQARPEPCPTLSASGDRLYVRVGPGVVKPGEAAKGGETAIVCVRVTPRPDGTCSLKELWRLHPPRAEEKTAVSWEGAPLVAGRRMWAAYARFEGGRVVHGIACYDPSDGAAAPDRPSWATDVCDGPDLDAAGRARHELLTLAGPNVVFCSNTGAVVALDATTGRHAWAFRYPRARRTDVAHSPHPAPATYSAGRVFVAPSDGDRVYALDPETGKLLWASGTAEGAQVLGVSAGKLVVTVESPVRSVRGLDLETGSHDRPGGWIQHEGGGELGYGRGFVTDEVIVWPTRGGLFFLRPEDGSPITQPRGAPDGGADYFGNVVYADGVLVVVNPTEMWGYVSHVRQFGPPDPRSERDPARREFEQLIDRTERALAAGDVERATAGLVDAARGRMPKPFRAWAAARLRLLDATADDLPAADLQDEWLLPPDGIPVTLGELLRRRPQRTDPRQPSPLLPFDSCRCRTEDAPSLSPGADVRRTVRLAPGSAPLRRLTGAGATPKRLYTTNPAGLAAVSLADGETTRYDSPVLLTHAAELDDGFVAAGPLAVAVYGRGPGPEWVFRVPATEPLPGRPGSTYFFFGTEPPPPELSAFRLNGAWLFARLGEHHFLALDLRARRVAWVLGADGRTGLGRAAFPHSVKFGPAVGACGRHLVVQLSDGRRWFVDAETGTVDPRPDPAGRTARVWWAHGPTAVADALPVSEDAGLVRLIDPARSVVRWTYRAGRETGLAGDPPQVRGWNDLLLVAVARNHGIEFERLDPADGEPLWRNGDSFADAGRVDLQCADADAERVVVPAGDTVVAFSAADGKVLWEAALPEANGAGGWVVRAGTRCVIAYPGTALPREPVADVVGRVVRSFGREPALWRLPGLAAGAYDAWVAREVPVVLFDPETGRRLVRFDIPAAGPAVTAVFEGGLAVVATGDRVVWLE